MKKKIFFYSMILCVFTLLSCANEQCKCTGYPPLEEDECDCNIHEVCEDRKDLGFDCKVE